MSKPLYDQRTCTGKPYWQPTVDHLERHLKGLMPDLDDGTVTVDWWSGDGDGFRILEIKVELPDGHGGLVWCRGEDHAGAIILACEDWVLSLDRDTPMNDESCRALARLIRGGEYLED